MRAPRLFLVLPLLLGLGLVLPTIAPPAAADDLEEEIEARIERIEVLIEEAEALEEDGRRDLARAFRARAEELEEEVRSLRREAEAEEDEEREELEEDMEEMARQGMGVLLRLLQAANDEEREEAMGRALQLAELFEILMEEREEFEDEIEEHEEHEELEEEIEEIEEHEVHDPTELLRAALRAFREVDDEDLAKLMQRAIHVHELMLKGDLEGAREIVEKHGMEWPRMRELLRMAASLYGEWGHEETASALRKLAAREHPGRAGHREHGHEHGHDAPGHEEVVQRLAEMQKRAEAILHLAEVLREEIREMREAIER